MNELQLNRSTGINLLKEHELRRVLDKVLDYSFETHVKIEFIYNIELDSLSIHFKRDNELKDWFLFQADKLKQVNLRKLKSNITA